jgi:hypothetical protein
MKSLALAGLFIWKNTSVGTLNRSLSAGRPVNRLRREIPLSAT